MNIVILTNEYPPYVYGGAGVHVEYLSRELADMEDHAHVVKIFCFGDQHLQEGNFTVEGIAADGQALGCGTSAARREPAVRLDRYSGPSRGNRADANISKVR